MWLCGGSIEVIPCSKIAHIERAKKPYLPDLSVTMKRNALRVAEVWLDEYKHNVNIAWNLPLEVRGDTSLLLETRLHKRVFWRIRPIMQTLLFLLFIENIKNCGPFYPDTSHRIMG